MALPPGQRVHAGPMPRFGLDAYMKRRAVSPPDFKVHINGDVERALSPGVAIASNGLFRRHSLGRQRRANRGPTAGLRLLRARNRETASRRCSLGLSAV